MPSAESVTKVLDCIEMDEQAREDLLSLARGSGSDDWLVSGTPGMTPQLAVLLKYERTARQVTQWAPLVIPGVLQTSDYARAIMSAHGTLPTGDADARVNLRMARRDAVTRRRNPTTLVALVGEPAIRGGIGGQDVMIDQLHHLLDVAGRDNISLRVVSLSDGWHPGHPGQFMLYDFDRLPPVVYLEHYRWGTFVVEEDSIREFRAAADIITGLAMTQDESIELITELTKSMEEAP